MARERAVEEETVAQHWFPRMDSSSGSVLPDGERFEGTEGLIHKTLMRGRHFFYKKCRLALSVELTSVSSRERFAPEDGLLA
jgi:hypothetical protein